MSEVHGGNQAILSLIRSEVYRPKISDPYYDCSEIAMDLLKVGGKDIQLIYITPKWSYDVYIPELRHGQIVPVSYIYHYVVKDKIYIYDPRLSLAPILRKDYRALIRQFNPKEVTVQHEFIGQFGEIIKEFCEL